MARTKKSDYLTKYLCLACRRTFKRPVEGKGVRACPNCSGDAVRMGQKIRPPRLSSKGKWEVVLFLVRHGFYFDSIPVKDDSGRQVGTVAYPPTLEDAKEFAARYESHARPLDWLRETTHKARP